MKMKSFDFQTILPNTEFITGVEILKNNLNITLLPLVCHIKCRKDDQSFFTTTVSFTFFTRL